MRNLVARLLAAWLLLAGAGLLATGGALAGAAPEMRPAARRAAPRDGSRVTPPRERSASADADKDRGEGTGAGADADTDHSDEPPADAERAEPVQKPYRPVRLQVGEIIWLNPGQQGFIEAHPLIMGLAAMALATVTLLFFFLRGIKRPRNEDL